MKNRLLNSIKHKWLKADKLAKVVRRKQAKIEEKSCHIESNLMRIEEKYQESLVKSLTNGGKWVLSPSDILREIAKILTREKIVFTIYKDKRNSSNWNDRSPYFNRITIRGCSNVDKIVDSFVNVELHALADDVINRRDSNPSTLSFIVNDYSKEGTNENN